MKFNEYLDSLLGKSESKKLKEALKWHGVTIVVTGEAPASGKTELVKILRNNGYRALDSYETYVVNLDKTLSGLVPNISDSIEPQRKKCLKH